MDPALAVAQEFAGELSQTLSGVLPGAPELRALAAETGQRVVIGVLGEAGEIRSIPLLIGGKRVGSWKLAMHADLDSAGRFLKIVKSNSHLFADVDRTPLVRYEFDDGMQSAPVAHWQFHGERGAFSYLLGKADAVGRKATPYSLSSIHFPVGGARMRPGVDDFLEFLVTECGFDRQPTWKSAIRASRERYRRLQAKTIARDMQSEVAEVLANEGWTVSPPSGYEPQPNGNFLHRW